jgi:fructose-specific phosphotransferase system IIC component
MVALSLLVAVALGGCGSSSHKHGLLKAVVGAAIVHHELKKHHSHHALLKSIAAGAVIHHIVKH